MMSLRLHSQSGVIMRQLRSWIITVFVACLMLSSMTATKVSAATGTPVITVTSETYTSLRVS